MSIVEVWSPVVGHEGLYEVSNLGRVKCLQHLNKKGRLTSEFILSQSQSKYGYWNVGFARRKFQTHCLVLLAFIGPRPEGCEGCHNNGDSSDCVLSNLRWDTPKANAADKLLHGTSNCGERNPRAKLTESQVRSIRLRFEQGVSGVAISREFGIAKSAVSRIKLGQSWSSFFGS